MRMVVNTVTLSCIRANRTIRIQDVAVELWCCPHFRCIFSKTFGSRLNGSLIPFIYLPQPFVNVKRTVFEANLLAIIIEHLITLIGEWVVAILAVITSEGQVAQGMKIPLLNL